MKTEGNKNFQYCELNPTNIQELKTTSPSNKSHQYNSVQIPKRSIIEGDDVTVIAYEVLMCQQSCVQSRKYYCRFECSNNFNECLYPRILSEHLCISRVNNDFN